MNVERDQPPILTLAGHFVNCGWWRHNRGHGIRERRPTRKCMLFIEWQLRGGSDDLGVADVHVAQFAHRSDLNSWRRRYNRGLGEANVPS